MSSPTPPSGLRSSRDRVYAALIDRGLRPSRTADDFMALCPVHEDSTASLHVTWSSRGDGGKVLLKCFACDAPAADIAEALNLTQDDLFDEPLPPRPTAQAGSSRAGRSAQERRLGKGRGKAGRLPDRIAVRAEGPAQQHSWVEVDTYTYVDPHAAVVQTVIRRHCTACERMHKEFVQRFARTPGGPLQKRKPDGFEPVLYRLPEVREAIATGQVVWLLEGEKDVHTAEGCDLAATTNPGGGATFPEHLADELAGARVHVVLDRDETGWSRGVHLHELLVARAAQVKLLLPAVTDAKSDFTDHVEAGHSLAELAEVSVDELRAWAAVAQVSHQLRLMRVPDEEVQARLERAEQADLAGKGEAAATERRYAQRWATHSVVLWGRLSAELDTVRQLAETAGTSWVAEAVALARSAFRQGRALAVDLHRRSGLELPGELRQITVPESQGPAFSHSEASDVATPEAGTAGGPPDPASAQQGPQKKRSPRRQEFLPSQSRYAVVKGCLVEIKPVKKERRDEASGDWVEEWEETYRPVLNLDVRIVATERPAADHDGEDQVPLQGRSTPSNAVRVNAETPPTHIVFAFTHPLTEQEERVRVEFDRAVDSSWLSSLAHLGLVYDSRPAGRARVWDAIRQTSPDIMESTLHRATGWRDLPEYGWGYIHARGAITAKGHVDVPVSLDGPMARFDLPDPSDDAAVVGRAFREHSLTMMEKLPARVSSVLIGHMFRAVLSPNGFTPVLVGSPGSYKTGVAALTMHYLGEAWDRKKPALSLSGNGDTFNTIRFKLWGAKDAVLFGDDLAPTKDIAEAQKLLEQVARLIHNQEERGRMDRTGLKASSGTPPRGSGLLTSEVMPRPGSGAQRLMPIPLLANELDIHHIIELDRFESRYGRALLMSSYLQWVASDLPQCRERAKTVAAGFKAELLDAGNQVRQSDAYSEVYAGWDMLSVFLLDIEAITVEERAQLLGRVRLALLEAMQVAEDPDVPTSTGARVREMIVHALTIGTVHVVDIHTGECPQWPLAARLGHRRTPAPGASPMAIATGEASAWRTEARGFPLGWVNTNPRPQDGSPELVIERLALEQLLKTTAHNLSDAPQLDAATAMRELHSVGVLKADDAGSRLRFTRERTLHCLASEDGLAPRNRKIVLDLRRLLGDLPEPEPEHDPWDRKPTPGGGGAPPDVDAPSNDVAGSQLTIPDDAPAEQIESDPLSPAIDDLDADSAMPQDLAAAEESAQQTMPITPYTPRPIQDAEGNEALIEPNAERTTCLLCPRPVGIRIDDKPIHTLCWERSTPATRAAAATLPPPTAERTQEPALPPVAEAVAEAAPAPVRSRPSPSASPVSKPSPAPDGTPVERRTWDGRTALTDPAVAVCHAGGVVLGDGTVLPLPKELTHLGQLAELGGQLKLGSQAQRRHLEAGTIVITDDLAAAMGVPVEKLPADASRREEALQELSAGHPFVTAAVEAGWRFRSADRKTGLRGWMRMQHDSHATVRVAFASVISGAVVEGISGRGDGQEPPTPQQLARRLQLFADQMGYPWRVSGGATGIDMMIGLRWDEHERLFPQGRTRHPALEGYIEGVLDWSRPLLETEKQRRYLHVYDRGGSWGTGIPGHELPIGEATHVPGGAQLDAKVPGFHRVRVPEATWYMPNPIWVPAHSILEDGTAWVATPSLVLPQDLGWEVPILESLIWNEHARILDSWCTRFSKARTALDTADLDDQVAREMVKETYTRGIGTMMSAESWVGRAGYFPERAFLIIAKARTNLLRRVNQIGQDHEIWPVAVHTDSIAYVSDEPDPWKAWPGEAKHLGRGMGQLRPERSGNLPEHLSRLGGPRWEGKTKLAKVDRWMRQLDSQPGEEGSTS